MDKLINIVATIFDAEDCHFTLETSRQDIEGWDSLSHLRLISEIEESFDIEIPIEEMGNIQKIGDFLKYLRQ